MSEAMSSITGSNGTSIKMSRPGTRVRLGLLLNIAAVSVSISSVILLFDRSLFSWHPVLMTLGFLLFMTWGVMSAVQFKGVSPGPDRVKAIWGHAFHQLRAVAAIAGGFAAIYQNKINYGRPHFQSLHAKFGLATLILCILVPVLGAVCFRTLGLLQKFPDDWQPQIKTLHKQAGLLVWLMALVTIELGLPHKAVDKGRVTRLWQAGVSFMGIAMLILYFKKPSRAKSTNSGMFVKAV